MRYWVALGLSVLVIVALAALYWFSPGLPRITLPNGSQFQVLKLSVGTNHLRSTHVGWKAFAAEALPAAWSRRLGFNPKALTSPRDSMVLWITELTPRRSSALPALKTLRVIFPGGRRAPGRHIVWGKKTSAIEFSIYPRDQEMLRFRFEDQGQPVEFDLPNPKPVQPANWRSQPLPQTNLLARTAFILITNSHPDFPLRLAVRPLAGEAGWLHPRTEVFDAVGNWLNLGRGFSILRPDHPLHRGPVRLVAYPSEYISVGMVALPSPGASQALLAAPRARDLGLEHIFLVGPGSYLILDGSITRLQPGQSPPRPCLRSTIAGNDWSIELAITNTSLILLSRHTPGTAELQGRLRERIPPDSDGRTFHARHVLSATNPLDPRHTARLFPIPLRTFQTNLEAEVIAIHPPSEFFVDQNVFSPDRQPE